MHYFVDCDGSLMALAIAMGPLPHRCDASRAGWPRAMKNHGVTQMMGLRHLQELRHLDRTLSKLCMG